MSFQVSLRLRECVYLVLTTICLAMTAWGKPPPTLRHVNMLYRHGDRSPVYIYPTDKHQVDNAWPDGLGWLTNIGKQQQYELGKYLRDRYGGFINVTRYNHSEITVEASAVQRCLMSAYSNLAGLFPPQNDQEWNQDLSWQPIPVLTRPTQEDNKLAMGAKCPRYDQLLAEAYQSDKVMKYMERNAEFLQHVEDYTGVKKEELQVIWQVGDTLVCEKAHNLTWNDWVYKNGTFQHVEELVTFGWDLLFGTTERAKLKGGPLLKEMIENMKNASIDSNYMPKIHMYSAHDTTVSALMSAMDVFNQLQPPYRTLVLVELHKINNEDVVQIYVRNDTTRDPYPLSPTGCGKPCKLSKFISLMSHRIPQDWEAECKVINSANSLSIVPVLGLGLILSLLRSMFY